MKDETEIHEKKYKIKVTIDPELNKYDNIILFPEKVKEAKETIARIGLPDAIKKRR